MNNTHLIVFNGDNEHIFIVEKPIDNSPTNPLLMEKLKKGLEGEYDTEVTNLVHVSHSDESIDTYCFTNSEGYEENITTEPTWLY
jgi:hypothetical protein